MLREWEAIVLQTIQLNRKVYVKQLPVLLSETQIWSSGINPSRDLVRLEESGYVRSRYARRRLKPQRPNMIRDLRIYTITSKGREALASYQEHLRGVLQFLKRSS